MAHLMAQAISRFPQRTRSSTSAPFRRAFSVKAIYSSFPATLLHYSPRPHSYLVGQNHYSGESETACDHAVTVEKDGLVYPAVKQPSLSNGAVMYPNTFMMQEFIRMWFDMNLDREESGLKVETPYVYTIPKGTPIPSHFILINEYIAKFSLQPAHGIPLTELNNALDEFYDKHAIKEEAGNWIESHPYQDALDDDADATWMAK